MKRILLVEDDPSVRSAIVEILRLEHFEVEVAVDGDEGYRLAGNGGFDLILLDLMLPLKNGMEICRDLRAAGVTTPLIMITARGEEIDRVLGLEIGADDYVTKPFSLRELVARVRAVLRRAGSAMESDQQALGCGDLHLDPLRRQFTRGGEFVPLTVTEFDVLHFMMRNAGAVVTRDTLLNSVWGYESFPTTRTVDNVVLSLRKKIEPDPSNPRRLLTVHGAGYRFVEEE